MKAVYNYDLKTLTSNQFEFSSSKLWTSEQISAHDLEWPKWPRAFYASTMTYRYEAHQSGGAPFVLSAIMTLPNNRADVNLDSIWDAPYASHCLLYLSAGSDTLRVNDARCYHVVLDTS